MDKLPKKVQEIFNNFEKNNDREELRIALLANLETQKTLQSRTVRQSQLRSVLKNKFGFSETDIPYLQFDRATLDAYNAALANRFEERRDNVISTEDIEKIMKRPKLNALLRSGRRFSELKKENMRVDTNGDIYFKILKKGDEVFKKITILGDSREFLKLMDTMQDTDISTENKAIKELLPHIPKNSTHILRGIYVELLYRYYNPDNLTKPTITKNFLHHEDMLSGPHYQHIRLTDDFTIPDALKPFVDRAPRLAELNAMRMAELRQLARERNLRGYSRMRKAALIDIIMNSE